MKAFIELSMIPGIIENIIGNIYSPFIFIKIYIIIVYPKIRPNQL